MNLLNLLQQYNFKLTTAESCTGGMLASEIIDIPGISQFYEQGFITYSENAKINMIDVPKDIIERYGVVSLQTAEAMAKGAAQKSHSDCAISTTGVAGPDGGTECTPVGCVCFGCYISGQCFSIQKVFSGTRNEIRRKATRFGIDFLIQKMNEVMLCE